MTVIIIIGISKLDSDETIREVIKALNVLPNQFYPALEVFFKQPRGDWAESDPNFLLVESGTNEDPGQID